MADRENKSLDQIEEEEQAELAAKRKQEKKRFNLFDRFADRDGQGVPDDEEDITADPNLKNYFKMLGRKLNRLLTVNLYIIIGNFPIFFLLLANAGYFSAHSTAPYYQQYAALWGVTRFGQTPVTAALWGIFGAQVQISVNTTATYVLYGLGALLIITFGLVNTGVIYNLRSMVRAEPVFMWSDFTYAIKKNLKQAIGFGLFDAFLCVMLTVDIVFFLYNMSVSIPMNIMFYLSVVMAIIWFWARIYGYLMMVTFDLSFVKLVKNSLIFALLGIKRNMMAFLGVVVIVLLNWFIYLLFIPLGVILPFIITIAVCMFTSVYCAWPVIKKYMIDGVGAPGGGKADAGALES